VRDVLTYSTDPATRQSTRDVLRRFQSQVGGPAVFADLVFADQRFGRAYEVRDRTQKGGYRTIGPGKDVICRERGYHAIVDDHPGICKACKSQGLPTFPIRRGQERHRWTSASYADVLAAAEAIGVHIDAVKAKREVHLARLAGPSRLGRNFPRLPNVEVPDSSDDGR
jgi:hypothetical protein